MARTYFHMTINLLSPCRSPRSSRSLSSCLLSHYCTFCNLTARAVKRLSLCEKYSLHKEHKIRRKTSWIWLRTINSKTRRNIFTSKKPFVAKTLHTRMSSENLSSLLTIPVELVYRILNHLSAYKIFLSVCNVCVKLDSIIDTYQPYQVKLTCCISQLFSPVSREPLWTWGRDLCYRSSSS